LEVGAGGGGGGGSSQTQDYSDAAPSLKSFFLKKTSFEQ